nr:G-type lectin S-receptor-like serine/threonine-protein kinase SD2-5 [Ipomoea batatas]
MNWETSRVGMSGARAEGWKESNSHGEERIGRAGRSHAWQRSGWTIERHGRQVGCPVDSMMDSSGAVENLPNSVRSMANLAENSKEIGSKSFRKSDQMLDGLRRRRLRFQICELGCRLPLPEKMSTKEDVSVLHAGRGLCRWRWIAVGGGDGLSVLKSVSWSGGGLNLTENGNLVIFGKSNETIWQSFDHPTNTLLPDQLTPGQTLNASISKSNLEEGSYSVKVDDNYFPYAYFRSSIYWYEYDRGANLSEYLQTDEFLKFEPDGHLRTYGWSSTNEPYRLGAISDVFAPSFGFCAYTLACGRYGVCDDCDDHSCNCPPQLSFFTQINSSDPK